MLSVFSVKMHVVGITLSRSIAAGTASLETSPPSRFVPFLSLFPFRAFVTYSNNSNIFEYNITVSTDMAKRMYTACENVQFPGSLEYIGDIYPSPVALVEGLGSEGRPFYA